MILVAIRIVVLVAFVILIACGIGLFVMAGVAQSHDVVRIPAPNGTFISGDDPHANYTDAYIAPLGYSGFRDIGRVAEQAFYRGDKEIYRDDGEVTYQGTVAGMFHYKMSYLLAKDQSPQTLTVVSSITLAEGKKARYLWVVAKPIHRHLIPYLLDRMVIMAPD